MKSFFITAVIPEHSEGESLFYIISPKDIVVAKERDQDDHIDWLLEKKKYEVRVQNILFFSQIYGSHDLRFNKIYFVIFLQEALMAAEISFKNIKRHDVQVRTNTSLLRNLIPIP